MFRHDDPGDQAKVIDLMTLFKLQGKSILDAIVAEERQASIARERQIATIAAVLIALSMTSFGHRDILPCGVTLGAVVKRRCSA